MRGGRHDLGAGHVPTDRVGDAAAVVPVDGIDTAEPDDELRGIDIARPCQSVDGRHREHGIERHAPADPSEAGGHVASHREDLGRPSGVAGPPDRRLPAG